MHETNIENQRKTFDSEEGPSRQMTQMKQVVSRFEVDIPVVDMDYEKNILYTAGGREFFEVNSNIWKEKNSDAAYLGTGRHGGGIVLRIMFVKVGGHWMNVATGKAAPFNEDEFDI